MHISRLAVGAVIAVLLSDNAIAGALAVSVVRRRSLSLLLRRLRLLGRRFLSIRLVPSASFSCAHFG